MIGKSAVLCGAGRMGLAMAKGWFADLAAAGLSHVSIVDPMPSEAAKELAVSPQAALNPAQPAPVDVMILAIKPQMLIQAADSVKAWIGPQTLVISVLAGVTLERLEDELGANRVVRTMPNTPGAVGAGVTAYCLSKACSSEDQAMVDGLLKPLGAVEGPLDESLMDAVTVVSGSGPAYAFLLVESMAAAGVALGLEPEMAQRLARQTVIGAGVLMDQDPTSAEDLRKAVTSPNGVTQAALEVMMADGAVPDVFKVALAAAEQRSKDLSRGD